MEMSKLEKVIRGLRDIDMFIAGRLEHEKAKNFLRTIDETIILLKEQEAEKPIAKEDDTYECCICGAIVGRDELDASGIVQERFNYCQNCGKAVKWE